MKDPGQAHAAHDSLHCTPTSGTGGARAVDKCAGRKVSPGFRRRRKMFCSFDRLTFLMLPIVYHGLHFVRISSMPLCLFGNIEPPPPRQPPQPRMLVGVLMCGLHLSAP